jgi:hypothetical protein
MSHKKKTPYQRSVTERLKQKPPTKKQSSSLLDVMTDGREFESLLSYQFVNVQLVPEIRRCLNDVSAIRNNPLICYIANVVKPRQGPVSIDDSDDLPFNEMVLSLPATREIDIVLVSPGGFAHQVAKFVNTLRARFEKVNFLIPNKAMSAGTIFALSGDEIVMTRESNLGPIDPQVRNRNGEFIPAQALLTLIEEIKERGERSLNKGVQPNWVDLQLLKSMDPRDIGNALSSSKYSISLVTEYLSKYKFKTWKTHSDGRPVTDDEKEQRANEIASLLCSHKEWKIHGHAITREAAWEVCKLRISHAEDIPGLERAMRRMWALFYWAFENTLATKVFVSENYCIIRSDRPQNDQTKR